MTLSRFPKCLSTNSRFIRPSSSSRWPASQPRPFSIMVSQSSSSARCADAENTPPTARLSPKSKVRGGIQGSSRRRRARSAGGPLHPRYAVGHAKHKSAIRQRSPRNDVQPAEVQISDAAIAVSTSPVSLPRHLSRPTFRPVAEDAIASVAPELANTALDYIREGLECLGPE